MFITLIGIVIIDLETDQSKASSTKAGGGEVGSRVIPNWSPPEATFTDYSISSSVVPRNKGGEREKQVVFWWVVFGTSEQGRQVVYSGTSEQGRQVVYSGTSEQGTVWGQRFCPL